MLFFLYILPTILIFSAYASLAYSGYRVWYSAVPLWLLLLTFPFPPLFVLVLLLGVTYRPAPVLVVPVEQVRTQRYHVRGRRY